MHLVDLHVPTSHRSLELNPDLQSLAATQSNWTATSDLRHCARHQISTKCYLPTSVKLTDGLFPFLAVAVDDISRTGKWRANVHGDDNVRVELGKFLKLSLKVHFFQYPEVSK